MLVCSSFKRGKKNPVTRTQNKNVIYRFLLLPNIFIFFLLPFRDFFRCFVAIFMDTAINNRPAFSVVVTGRVVGGG